MKDLFMFIGNIRTYLYGFGNGKRTWRSYKHKFVLFGLAIDLCK